MLEEQRKRRNIFLNTLRWLFASEVRAALAIGGIVAIYVLLRMFGFADWSKSGIDLRLVISMLIFSVFVGVIIITDGDKKYKKNGNFLRAICGCVAGAAIGVIYAAAGEVLFLLSISGVILGTFGRRLLDGL